PPSACPPSPKLPPVCDGLAAFAGLTAEQVVARLERASIANAQANAMQDVWDHPQLAARDRWRTVETQNGPVPALLPPGMASDGDARMDPVPALGQHTDRILAELGYAPGDIARLRDAKAV
ncbi:CoA transferase, partial [Azospirillum brasilense]|uniref:CoA transferase n=1 Tax=Azospirillum brasilense TaxID=192 RepID=UPI0019657EB5